MVFTSSRILSCEVWLMLMRNTSAPASNRRRIIALSEEAGPSVARILMRRRRLMAWLRALRLAADPARSRPAGWRCPECSRDPRHPLGRLLLIGLGQLHGPGALLAGVDLEEAGTVETAGEAIVGSLDGELLVARAHEGLS